MDASHISIPAIHCGDSMKVVCCLFPHMIAWMCSVHKRYLAANSAHGSDNKLRQIQPCILDCFEAAKAGRAALPERPPSVTVGGIKLDINAELRMDLTPVLDKFKSLPREWNFIRKHGKGLRPRNAWPADSVLDCSDVLTFLVGREELLPSSKSNVLRSCRNAIASVAGTRRLSK